MKTSFTPGPWQHYAGNTRLCVETVGFPAKLTAVVYAGKDTSGDVNDSEQLANAKLIAAAPELLAALQHTLRVLTVNTISKLIDLGHPEAIALQMLNDVAPIAEARAAILKALGSVLI